MIASGVVFVPSASAFYSAALFCCYWISLFIICFFISSVPCSLSLYSLNFSFLSFVVFIRFVSPSFNFFILFTSFDFLFSCSLLPLSSSFSRFLLLSISFDSSAHYSIIIHSFISCHSIFLPPNYNPVITFFSLPPPSTFISFSHFTASLHLLLIQFLILPSLIISIKLFTKRFI